MGKESKDALTYGIEFDSEASQFGRGCKRKETGAGSGTAQVGPMTWTSEEAPNLPCEEDGQQTVSL